MQYNTNNNHALIAKATEQMKQKDKRKYKVLLENAIYVANKNIYALHRHGAIITYKKLIVATATNTLRKNNNILKYGYEHPNLHAEAAAIIKALQIWANLRNCEILVIRLGTTKLKNSKPCQNCMNIINETGIKKVTYSNENGNLQTIKVRK